MIKEEKFLELCSGLKIKYNEETYPGRLFWFKDEKFMFFISLINDGLCTSSKQALIFLRLNKEKLNCHLLVASVNNFWLIFEKEYNMNYNETQSFIKRMIEKYFKLISFDVAPTNVKYNIYL